MDSDSYVIVDSKFVRKTVGRVASDVIHAVFAPGSGFICACGFWTEDDPEFHNYVGGGLDV